MALGTSIAAWIFCIFPFCFVYNMNGYFGLWIGLGFAVADFCFSLITSSEVWPVSPFSFSSSAITRKKSRFSLKTKVEEVKDCHKSMDWNTPSGRPVDVDVCPSVKFPQRMDSMRPESLCVPLSADHPHKPRSVNHLSYLRGPKAKFTLALKSFHCRQSFSDIAGNSEELWINMNHNVKTVKASELANLLLIYWEKLCP